MTALSDLKELAKSQFDKVHPDVHPDVQRYLQMLEAGVQSNKRLAYTMLGVGVLVGFVLGKIL